MTTNVVIGLIIVDGTAKPRGAEIRTKTAALLSFLIEKTQLIFQQFCLL